MSYYISVVANSVLERSFEDKRYVSPNRLHALLLLMEAEYYRKTRGNHLLSEAVMNVTPEGLVFPSVSWKFDCYRGTHIERYSRDAKGSVYCVAAGQDRIFDAVLALVWAGTSGYSDDGLLAATTRGSEWQHCLDRGLSQVKTVDVVQGLQYRNLLPELA